MADTFTAALALLDDATLARMTANAWREAARAWQEYRAISRQPEYAGYLFAAAQSAEGYWQQLAAESKRRAGR